MKNANSAEKLSLLALLEIQHSWAGGLPSTIRTCDLRLRRPLLYPTELWAEAEKST